MESLKLPSQCLQPGVPDWVLQIESLPNLSDISVSLPAATTKSSAPPGAPTPPLDINYGSSTTSESMNPSLYASVTKLARHPHSLEPNCWDMYSAPVSCIISPPYTVNSLVVSILIRLQGYSLHILFTCFCSHPCFYIPHCFIQV